MTLDLYGHDDAEFGTTVRYSVSNLAAAQARLGDHPEVHLLTSAQPRSFTVVGVQVHFHSCIQAPRSASLRFRFARQFSLSMVRALVRDRVDVIHFHGARQIHPMFAAIAWRARQQGIPLVSQDRGSRPVGRLETLAQQYALRWSSAALASGRESLEALAALGAPRDALQVVPNGFDPQIFRAADERRRPSTDPFRVLAVTRLEEEKDPITMAEGLCRLARLGRAFTLTVCGRGSLRARVEERLRAESVPVHFIDHLPQEELAEQYRAADALLLTSSVAEGWNQAILEAMACGLPVIATDVPGTRDVLDCAGILIPARDPGALANSLLELGDNPEMWQHYRKLGLERVQKFTWESVARQLHDIYDKVLEGPASPGGRRLQGGGAGAPDGD